MVMAGDVPDVMYLRGKDTAKWFKSNWIQPIDDLIESDAPWIDEMYPSVRSYMQYDGHWIGLPYYVGYQILIYNEETLRKAGFTEGPKSLEEWARQMKVMQEKKLCDYGFYPNWAQGEITVVRDFQVFNALFGGKPLLDETSEPTFDTPNAAAHQALRWMVDAIHKEKIFPPDSAAVSERDSQNAFYAGRIPFYIGTFYVLSAIRNPKNSQVTEVARAALIPGAEGKTRSASALFARAYVMGSKTAGEKREAAWKLMKFLGGKYDNEYYGAKTWVKASGLGYGWKPLEQDPEVQEAMRKLGSVEVLNLQQEHAFPQNRIQNAIWFSEWEEYSKVQLNKALLGTQGVEETLKNMADKARQLKQRYGR
jgi:multiple sugar transport system substrate-binding protein